jgi:hypothetical protein
MCTLTGTAVGIAVIAATVGFAVFGFAVDGASVLAVRKSEVTCNEIYNIRMLQTHIY